MDGVTSTFEVSSTASALISFPDGPTWRRKWDDIRESRQIVVRYYEGEQVEPHQVRRAVELGCAAARTLAEYLSDPKAGVRHIHGGSNQNLSDAAATINTDKHAGRDPDQPVGWIIGERTEGAFTLEITDPDGGVREVDALRLLTGCLDEWATYPELAAMADWRSPI